MPVDTTDILITTVKEELGSMNLKVEVPLTRVQAAQNKATKHYAGRAKLPGFRKGKAPRGVILKHYRDAIRETVVRELIGEAWQAAMDQQELKPISEPRVRDLKFEDGAPVTFELVVEIKPEIALDRLGGFKLSRTVTPATAEMVSEQVDDLRRQKAPWVPVADAKPQQGELVSVSIRTIGGEEEQEAQEKQYQIQLGSGQAIPDLEEKIMTLTPGETIDTSVRYPDDFAEEAKRGQTRRVEITLHEAKRQELPELSDSFARELGDFETVEALKSAIRDDLQAAAEREADADVRRQLIDQIVASNNLEAPRTMVQRVLSTYAKAYEVPDERLEQFATEFGPIAEQQVKRELILDHVIEREGLAATEAEVDQRIEELAKRRNAKPKELYTSLQKANRLRELERNITEEKVFSYLLEQSSVIEG